MIPARRSSFEGVPGHSLDFENGVFGQVAGLFARDLVLAKIDVAGQFPHDFEIAIAETFRAQRRNIAQRGAQSESAED